MTESPRGVAAWAARRRLSAYTERVLGRMWVVFAVLFAGLAMLGSAPPAFAHASLVKSEPADGAVLADPPGAVTLVFDDAIESAFTEVVVLDAEGTHQERGEPHVAGDTVTQPLAIIGAGVFRVSYRVAAADGHPVTGTLTFVVGGGSDSTAAAPSAAPYAGATPTSEDAPAWVLISTGVIGLAVLSTALAALVLRRRPRADNGRAHVKPEDASEEP